MRFELSPPFQRAVRLLTALTLLLIWAHPVWAERTIQPSGERVVDTAGVIDAATRQRIERLLEKLERATTDQVKLLTVPDTDGEDIFEFTQRHFDLWQLGQKGKDNGVLIVFDRDGRHIRVHTGYGVEGALPDSWIGTLSREIAREYFKQRRYSEGLYQLTLAVVQRVADDAGVKLQDEPRPRVMPPVAPAPLGFFPCCVVLLPLAIILLMSWISWRRRRRGWRGGRRAIGTPWGTWGPMFPPSGGSPWAGGGGFSGGFGGGGGSFGGGGRSGGGGGGASW